MILSVFEEIKQKITELNKFKNVKLEIESNGISAKDVPFCRIKHEVDSLKFGGAVLEYTVYIGIKKDNDSESDFKELIELSNEVIDKLIAIEIRGGLNSFIKRVSDDGTIKNFRMMALEFKLDGYDE